MKPNMNMKIGQAVVLPHPRLLASFWVVLRSVHLCAFYSKSLGKTFLCHLCLFLAPSCDVCPKISENLLWIFPGSNWLNPKGGAGVSVAQLTSVNEKSQPLLKHFWHFSSEFFLTFLSLFETSANPFTAAEINGSPVSRLRIALSTMQRGISTLFLKQKTLQLSWVCWQDPPKNIF